MKSKISKRKVAMIREISVLRRRIDRADLALLKAFSERFSAVEKLGRIKKKLKLPAKQKARWKEVMKDRLRRGARLGVAGPFINSIYKIIHKEAIRIQTRRGRS